MNSDTKPDSPAPAPLRASDADREATADVLRTGFEQGRLTTEEFDERLQAAYNARTHADLAALTGDLPAPAAPPPAPRPSRRAAQVRDHVLTYVIFMLFFIGIWVASGRHGSFWPIWPILIGGFILALDLLPGQGHHPDKRECKPGRRQNRRD